MKKNFAVIFLCFLAGLAGGNISPILTGTGYIKFPETSPSASISASGGQLTAAAGGVNQHVLLLPSGGTVGVNTSNPTPLAITLGSYPALTAVNPNTAILGAYSNSVPNFALNMASDGSWTIYDHGSGNWVQGLIQTGGRVGVGVIPNTNYQLDVSKDINTATQFRVAGTPGLSIVKTIRNSANTGTCTMTFSGGILTASTC
jgi:hypothetical protein